MQQTYEAANHWANASQAWPVLHPASGPSLVTSLGSLLNAWLPLIYFLSALTVLGIWRPVDWTSNKKRIQWAIYFVFSNFFHLSLLTSMMIYFCLAKSAEELIERSFRLPSVTASSIKALILLLNRKKVLRTHEFFFDKLFAQRSSEEQKILNDIYSISKIIYIACVLTSGIAILMHTLMPILIFFGKQYLSIPVWLMFEITSDFTYSLVMAWEFLAFAQLVMLIVNVGWVFICFLITASLLFDILAHRWDQLAINVGKARERGQLDGLIDAYEKKVVKENVLFHIHLLKCLKESNNTFAPILLIQFISCTVVMATTIYQLGTATEVDTNYLIAAITLISLFIENLIYFWYSNEVKEKSQKFQEALYKINWSVLSISTRKSILIIMMRASDPVIIKCGSLFKLTLESYISILKTSYSIYNLFRTANE